VDLSKKIPSILDAKFTNFTQNAGDILSKKYKEHEKISPDDQMNYKYIVTMDGNGGTYGLYWTLLSGSLALNNTTYRQWFSPFFMKNVHYKEFQDISGNANLDMVINESMKNSVVSKNIAYNSRKLAKTIFSENFVLFYLYTLLDEYSKIQLRSNYSGIP
jgi:hypothetical protein